MDLSTYDINFKDIIINLGYVFEIVYLIGDFVVDFLDVARILIPDPLNFNQK